MIVTDEVEDVFGVITAGHRSQPCEYMNNTLSFLLYAINSG